MPVKTKRELEEEVARLQEQLNLRDDQQELEQIKRKQEREQSIVDQLSEDEKERLQLKWGYGYSWSEYIRMEQTYDEYASEYEISVDREQVLKNICKTALKMDQALDSNNIKDYKDLSSVFDQLRKSGKFTDSQKREKKEREIDSIGQLVAFVEDEGGVIPQAPDSIEEPQDRVDFMIKDMKNYVDNLVRNELGLGNLIESYIKKAEQQKPKTVDEVISRGFNQQEMTKEDIIEWNKRAADEMLADNDMFGGDFDGFESLAPKDSEIQ